MDLLYQKSIILSYTHAQIILLMPKRLKNQTDDQLLG